MAAAGIRTLSINRTASLKSLSPGHSLVPFQRFGNLPAYGIDRIEAGHRLLKDHGYPIAAKPFHFLVGKAKQVGSVKKGLTRDASGFSGQQPHD